ncbi:MAG: CRISPR-associated endonuclease Cas3'' [Haloechinothrix sp.]
MRRTVADVSNQGFDVDRALGVLWGKSRAGDSMNLLLQHLLDTAAVAELLWDRYLAATLKAKIDACCGGQGRSLLALLCGLHDVGKASPAFQAKSGLSWRSGSGRSASIGVS